MMRLERASVIGVLVLSIPSAAYPSEPLALWGPVRVGMSVDEVRRVVPLAVVQDHPSVSKEGWVGLLRARIQRSKRDQNVLFQFQDTHLISVLITEGAPFGLTPIDQRTADSEVSDLAKAYGTPVRCRTTEDGFHACFWLKGGMFVGYLQRPPPIPAMMVFLHAEQAGDADLLK